MQLLACGVRKGEIVNRDVRPSTLELTLSSFITRNDGTKARSIQGATSAYQTSFLKMPIFPSYRIDGEDAIFSSIANAIGLRIEYIDLPTVLYRVHLAAISNVPEERNWSIELEERSRRRLAQHYAVGTYILQILKTLNNSNNISASINFKRLEAGLRSIHVRMTWDNKRVIARLGYLMILLSCSLFPHQDKQAARWMAARILGKFPRYQPLTFIKNIEWKQH